MKIALEYMAEPPPGYIRQEAGLPNLHQGLKGVGVSTTLLAFIAVTLRLITRVHLTKNGVQLDDCKSP